MTAPMSYRLAPIAARLAAGGANMIALGDSLFTSTQQPRMSGMIARTWDIPWKGITVGGYSQAPNSGIIIYSLNAAITANNYSPGDTMAHASATNDFPLNSCEYQFSADIANFGTWLRPSITKTFLDSHVGGNWADNTDDMKVRTMWRRSGDEPTSCNIITRRGDGTSSVDHASYNFSSGAAGLAYVDSDFLPIDSGGFDQTEMDYYLQAIGSIDETGGWLNICGHRFWKPNAVGNELCCIAAGGWGVTDHLDPTADADGKYTDAELETLMTWLDKPNTIVIQIGQNDGALSKSQYKTHLLAIIARYKARADSVGASDLKFLLLSTWDTASDNTRFVEYSEAMYEITLVDSTISFCNMRRLVEQELGAYATWQATYLEDGVHPKVSGTPADLFTSLVWTEMESALTETVVMGSGLGIGIGI